jgi:hypothetical protein
MAFIFLQKDQQMLKEVVDVLLILSKFTTPTCFGIWLPSSVVEIHDNWPHGTGHNPHMPITQNIA